MAEQPKKEEKRRAKYGTGVCLKWVFSKTWQWDKRIALSTFAVIPLGVILYAFNLYTPSAILRSLETADTFGTIVLTITVVLVAQMVFHLIKAAIDIMRGLAEHRHSMRFYYELIEQSCRDDYYLFLDPEYLRKRDGAFNVLTNHVSRGPGNFIMDFANVAINVLCFLIFGTVISTLHPAIIWLLIAGSLIVFFLQRWEQNRNHDKLDEESAANRKLDYLAWNLSNNPKIGKDVRLYDMASYLEKKAAISLKDIMHLFRYRQNNASVVYAVIFVIAALRDSIAYWFLIKGVLDGSIDSAMFVLYFSAITQMASFISDIVNYIGGLHEEHLKLSDCIEYLEEEHGVLNHGKGIPLPRKKALSIEFRNVTFRYPKGDKNILENISFTIKPGEKISLVGLNGAGKTTLTRLMCGLLVPDEGEVLIDGHSVFEYNIDELYTLFSLLPQEYVKLPTSVAENIALAERSTIDDERLWECLELAGIADKIRSLPHGVETSIDREADSSAVEFSGGEWQRLLLARVLYRDAPVMILDEPTAALDPIAENRMYQLYNEITHGATSVFISHRLASARFCDRVYLLDGATFAECGTHDELMALGGKYKELFDVQSKYYREGGEAHA